MELRRSPEAFGVKVSLQVRIVSSERNWRGCKRRSPCLTQGSEDDEPLLVIEEGIRTDSSLNFPICQGRGYP